MKKSSVFIWLVAALAGLPVAGCNKDTGGPDDQAPIGVSNEEQAMSYYAGTDEFVVNDEVTFADKDVEPMDYGTFSKIDAAITPLRFGRFITSVTKNITVTIQPGDSISIARVEKTIVGTLKIRAKTGAGDTVTITKPFTNQATRNVIFKRVDRNPRKFWLNWVPVATSLVDGGTSAPNDLVNLTKLEMTLPNAEVITITDPNSYYLRYRWLRLFTGGKSDTPDLTPGQIIKLRATVVSAQKDTDIVVLRYGFSALNRRRVHMTLVSQTLNSDGTYTRVFEFSWPVHFHRGYFHAGVEAMTKGTLFDDAVPVSVSWWGIPYRVL